MRLAGAGIPHEQHVRLISASRLDRLGLVVALLSRPTRSGLRGHLRRVAVSIILLLSRTRLLLGIAKGNRKLFRYILDHLLILGTITILLGRWTICLNRKLGRFLPRPPNQSHQQRQLDGAHPIQPRTDGTADHIPYRDGMRLGRGGVPQFVKLSPHLIPHGPAFPVSTTATSTGDGIPRLPMAIVLGIDDPNGMRIEGHADVAAHAARNGLPLTDQIAHGDNLIAGLASIDQIVLTFDEEAARDAAGSASNNAAPTLILLNFDLLIVGMDRHSFHQGKVGGLARGAIWRTSGTDGGFGQGIVGLF